MSDESIFQGSTSPAEEVVQKPAFTIPTEVVEFVGDGKKYATPEDALKSVPHAQAHIQKLEDEMKTLREELEKRKAVEDVISEFKKAATQPETTPQTGVDVSTITQLISQTLEQKEQARKAQQNTQIVIAKLTEKFGEKAEQEYVRIAQENGVPVPMLNALSANSPEAVLKLAGINMEKSSSLQKPTSSVNTEAIAGTKPSELSARVGFRGTTKDMVSAWRAAGEKVKQSN